MKHYNKLYGPYIHGLVSLSAFWFFINKNIGINVPPTMQKKENNSFRQYSKNTL